MGAGPGVTDLFDEEPPVGDQTAVEPRPTGTCTAADRTAAKAVWDKLRNVDYPYHLQTVALSPAFASGCRALIITEPPPLVSLEQLQAVAPHLLGVAEAPAHKIGYDGWTKDIVVTLPPLSKRGLTNLVAELHKMLFGTTYRMQTLDTSAPPPRYNPTKIPLDLAVGPGELNHWLVDTNPMFVPLRSDKGIAFQDLMLADEPGVYTDDSDHLVAWIIPRRSDIANMAGLFRQFTLESDVIVGAIGSKRAVAVVARKRLTDPRVVQPLRFETVSMLAAVHQDKLQQSYDRTNYLAGRIAGDRDWAPIFLSPELLDTEYGSLLDITDQMLKSWSNNGQTRYINFGYPNPNRPWAYDRPVDQVANAKGSFRYNWNTANVGSVINVDTLEIFWLRRTGALNVSYFPDEESGSDRPRASDPKMHAIEEKAYQFFTQTQTPMLIRVVQYNALFQIFTRFKLESSQKIPVGSVASAMSYLKTAARNALTFIRTADEGKIRSRLDGFLRPLSLSDAVPELTEYITDLSKMLQQLDQDDLTALGDLLGAPREATDIAAHLRPVYSRLEPVRLVFSLFSAPKLYEGYAARVATRSNSWIHTPSIVISWNTGVQGRMGIGGHDLDAAVSSVEFDRSALTRATQEMAEGKPVDVIGTRELERLVLGPNGPTLADAPSVRPARAALGISDAASEAEMPRIGNRLASPTSNDSVHVARLADGYRVTRQGMQYEVTSMPEVVELVSLEPTGGGRSIAIEFEGFSEDEARGVMRTAEIKGEARFAGVVKHPPEFATRPLDFSKATIYEPQVRVLPDGRGQIALAVEVPVTEKPSVWIRIKLAFRNASPQWLRETGAKIRELVRTVIEKLGGGSGTAKDIGVELRRQLKELVPESHHIELKLKHEMFDVTIVRRDPEPTSHGASSHTG